jgi:dedicator of cytokinesis protein 3
MVSRVSLILAKIPSLQRSLTIRFVVPPKTLSEITPDLRLAPPYTTPKLETQVIVGIFPASVAYVRPGVVNDDGALSAAFEGAVRDAQATFTNGISGDEAKQPMRELEGVREEVEDKQEGGSSKSARQDDTVEVIDVAASSQHLEPSTNGISRPNRPKSLLLNGKQPQTHPTKPQPPVPTITAGDSTIAGEAWPLVDEIACAIREWHEVRFQAVKY